MKKIFKYIFSTLLLAGSAASFSSCNYLDIVPDETATDSDAFADKVAALRYVYSCYAYLPNPRNGSGSLDFMTGDEVITAFEHETFAAFPKGNYSSSNTVISYWNTFFAGLRQCYLFLEHVDEVPNMDSETKRDYIAQVKFLIGYYHYLLIQCYGPVIIIDGVQDINTPVEDYKSRSPLDECVEFVCKMLDEAAADLPARRATISEYGLATSVAAKGLKAKMLLFAASPLFNGNSAFYSNFKNPDGTLLMPTQYDASKWEKCRQAMLEAIQLAENNGYALYTNSGYDADINPYPSGVTRTMRYTIMESGNSEILFADTRDEGWYGLQNKSVPRGATGAWSWNGVGLTWNMLNRFYTKNGLPYDEDPSTKNLDKFSIVTIGEEYAEVAAPGEQTMQFNLDREPRFYAWVAFQSGYYEVMSASSNGAYANDATYDPEGRLVCDFVVGGNTSRRNTASGSLRTNDYCPSGYLNKKGILPTFAVSTDGTGHYHNEYPWPILRLADLYLGYAEACVETNQLDQAKSYLNRVRERAGIPDVETSWSGVATLNQDKLRDIVRQERMVELYLENQNFWDMRRWLLAEEYFNQRQQGLNVDAETLPGLCQLTEIIFERKFQSPMNYLLPIPNSDLNTNPNLVNNPGY